MGIRVNGKLLHLVGNYVSRICMDNPKEPGQTILISVNEKWPQRSSKVLTLS